LHFASAASSLENFRSRLLATSHRSSRRSLKIYESHPLSLCAVFPDAFVSLPLKKRVLRRRPSTASPGVFQRSPSIVLSTAGVHSRSPVARFPSESALRAPFHVPSLRFLTCPTVFSSHSLRIYFNPLPILGFTAFHAGAKQQFPRVRPYPPKLSLRPQRSGCALPRCRMGWMSE